jgi:hypothetical protein
MTTFPNLNPNGTPTLSDYLGLIPEIVRRNLERERMESLGRRLGCVYRRRSSRTNVARISETETVECNLPLR